MSSQPKPTKFELPSPHLRANFHESQLAARLVERVCRGNEVTPRILGSFSGSMPVSLIRFEIASEAAEAVFIDAIFREPESQYVLWFDGGVLTVLRAGDELEAVVWADEIRASMQEFDIDLSAGVASTSALGSRGKLSTLVRMCDRARKKASNLGGRLVIAHSLLEAACREEAAA